MTQPTRSDESGHNRQFTKTGTTEKPTRVLPGTTYRLIHNVTLTVCPPIRGFFSCSLNAHRFGHSGIACSGCWFRSQSAPSVPRTPSFPATTLQTPRFQFFCCVRNARSNHLGRSSLSAFFCTTTTSTEVSVSPGVEVIRHRNYLIEFQSLVAIYYAPRFRCWLDEDTGN